MVKKKILEAEEDAAGGLNAVPSLYAQWDPCLTNQVVPNASDKAGKTKHKAHDQASVGQCLEQPSHLHRGPVDCQWAQLWPAGQCYQRMRAQR